MPRNAFSVAKEGKVFEQKKILQPLLGTHEGNEMGCIIFSSQVGLRRFTLMHSFQNMYNTMGSKMDGLAVREHFLSKKCLKTLF